MQGCRHNIRQFHNKNKNKNTNNTNTTNNTNNANNTNNTNCKTYMQRPISKPFSSTLDYKYTGK